MMQLVCADAGTVCPAVLSAHTQDELMRQLVLAGLHRVERGVERLPDVDSHRRGTVDRCRREVCPVLRNCAPAHQRGISLQRESNKPGGADVHEAQAMPLAASQHERRWRRVAVDEQSPRANVAVPSRDDDVVARRVEALTRLQHDDGAIQPCGELLEVTEVRVVDECAGTRLRQAGDERVTRGDGWCDVVANAAPSRHTVRIALELDAVPVDAGRLSQPVDDSDVSGAAAGEHQRRTGDLHRVGTRSVARLEDVAHRTRRRAATRALLHEEPQALRVGARRLTPLA